MVRPGDIAEFIACQAMSAFFVLTPRRLCLPLGHVLGILLFHLDGRHRRIALSNLKTAFGTELSERRRYAVARQSFVNFCRILIDVLKLAGWPRRRIEQILTVEGAENLRRAVGRGCGVLVFSGHFGNWEMLTNSLCGPAPVWAIARFLDNRLLEKRLSGFRTGLGAGIIYKEQAAREVVRALGRGDVVLIMIDQNVLRDLAVFVDFFGKPAGTTPALAAFHLRTGSAVLPAFCYPERGGRYRVKIFPALDFSAGGRGKHDVLKITQTCTKIIESQIRLFPENWLWFHDRWRSRPPGES
jgi:KDO2-lipid IV(A) lauroyltransferase